MMHRLTSFVAIAAMLGLGTGGIVPHAAAQAVQAPPSRPAASDTDALEDLIGVRDRLLAPEAADGTEAPLFDDAALDALVAPVALYPDALLAQVLVAATFPLQIVQADRLLQNSEAMSVDELSLAIEEQGWDPSVLVLLSAFPTVIGRMAEDLDWTEDLGDAMLSQDEDVLAAVQRMRADALAAGNLVSNAAQVVEEADDQIAIRPADPEVVYLPTYDPVTAYAMAPASPPATSLPGAYSTTSPGNLLANPLVAGALGFGAAVLVDELFGGGGGDDDDGGWDDYWARERPIDWRDREVYARPRYAAAPGGSLAWSAERDRFWNRAERRWQRDAARDRQRAEERRAALQWLERDAERRDQRLRALREREREAREAARRQEQAIERLREDTREAERAAEQARERRQRLEAREEQQTRESRQQEREKQQAREQELEDQKAREARQQDRKEREAREARQQDRGEQEAREARQQERKEREAREARQQDRREQEAREARHQERAKQQAREASQLEALDRQARQARRQEREQQEAQKQQAQEQQRPEQRVGEARQQQRGGQQGREARAQQRSGKGEGRRNRPPCENGDGENCRPRN